MAESEDQVSAKPTFSLGRLVPLGVMAGALIAFFALDLNQYLNFGIQNLKIQKSENPKNIEQPIIFVE